MSKKILVTYTSRYGSTEKYAKWIAMELHADILEAKAVTPQVLSQYDIIIYGGGLYAGGIAGVKLVTQSPCNQVIVFTVGLADPHKTDYTEIISKHFTPALLEKTKFFHLRGGIDYKKLSPMHRLMMAMMKRSIERKPVSQRSEENREFLNTYQSKVYFEEKESIHALIQYVTSL